MSTTAISTASVVSASEVVVGWPALADAGVTPLALGEILISIIYGIQTSWRLAELEQDPTKPQVTADEALDRNEVLLVSGDTRELTRT